MLIGDELVASAELRLGSEWLSYEGNHRENGADDTLVDYNVLKTTHGVTFEGNLVM